MSKKTLKKKDEYLISKKTMLKKLDSVDHKKLKETDPSGRTEL